MASIRPEQIPNYSEDMNYALTVLRLFNERDPSAPCGEKGQKFLDHLLHLIQQETHLDISWPEAIFYLSADRICHATAITLDLVVEEEA